MFLLFGGIFSLVDESLIPVGFCSLAWLITTVGNRSCRWMEPIRVPAESQGTSRELRPGRFWLLPLQAAPLPAERAWPVIKMQIDLIRSACCPLGKPGTRLSWGIGVLPVPASPSPKPCSAHRET